VAVWGRTVDVVEFLASSDPGEPPRARLRLVTFPTDDHVFAARVEAAFAALDGAASSRDGLVQLVQSLVPDYPSIEIRHQDGLGSLEPEPLTLYVFRDGHITG
jgi:hypothetical protein